MGEGSASKPGRLEQQGAQPLVISPGSGSAACLNTHIRCLAACLTAWLTWLTDSLHCYSLALSPSLSCSLAPSLLLSTLESESARIGKVLLRPASGQLEDSTERIFPLCSHRLPHFDHLCHRAHGWTFLLFAGDRKIKKKVEQTICSTRSWKYPIF